MVSFTANYAGYVLVSVSSASDYTNEGISVQVTYGSNVNSPNYGYILMPLEGYYYVFGSVPDAMPIPVTPGTITVYLGTADTSAQTATLSVTYYY